MHAIIATFREKYMERSTPKKEGLDHLVQNIRQLKKLIKKLGLPWIASQLNSILIWENNIKSILATCSFVGAVYVFQPWMASIPIFLMFLKNCRRLKNNDITNENFCNDEDEKDEKKTMMEKLSMMRNIYYKAEEIMDLIVRWTQRMLHFTEFKVPLLSGIAIGLLALFTLVLSLIPFRFIIIAVGVKFLLKNFMLAKYPHYQGMGKFVLNFLSKMPDNEELNRQFVNVSHVAASKTSENVSGDQEEDLHDHPSIAYTSGSNISITDDVPTTPVTEHTNLTGCEQPKSSYLLRGKKPWPVTGILRIMRPNERVCPNIDSSTIDSEDGSNNFHITTGDQPSHPRKNSKTYWYHEIEGSEMSEMSENE